MQPDYSLNSVVVDIQLPCQVRCVLEILVSMGCIENDRSYVYSVYGRRVSIGHVLCMGDRLECVLALPVSPIARRRSLVLRRKNR